MVRLIFILSILISGNCLAADNGVEISGRIECSGFILFDNDNFACLDSNASDGYDAGIDIPKPSPPTSNYVNTYFNHPEWSLGFGNQFMYDVRNGNDNLNDEVKIFLFEVDTDQEGEMVELIFNIQPDYQETYGLVLYDLESGVYQNIREDSVYSFIADTPAHCFNLRLGDGTEPVINITFPTPDTLLYINTYYDLTWEYLDVSPIRYSKLFYSIDNGFSWTFIDSIIGFNQSYNWLVPDSSGDSAKIKIEAQDWAGNLGVEITGYVFRIGCSPAVEDLDISIVEENVFLAWSDIPGASIYHIYRSALPYFDISAMIPFADSQNSEFLDENALATGNWFYRVTWEP